MSFQSLLLRSMGLSLIGLLLLTACSGGTEEESAVAKVQDQVLTLNELREHFPVHYEEFVSRDQYLDFIKRWIDNQVLYQEALKRGTDSRPEVARKVERMRRKIIVEEFLASDLFHAGLEPDEAALSQYYELNKDAFRAAGSATPLAFEEVRDEIRVRLISSRRNKLMDEKIQEFKEGLSIDYSLEKVPGVVDAEPSMAEELMEPGEETPVVPVAQKPTAPREPSKAAAPVRPLAPQPRALSAPVQEASEPTLPKARPRPRKPAAPPASEAIAPAASPSVQPISPVPSSPSVPSAELSAPPAEITPSVPNPVPASGQEN